MVNKESYVEEYRKQLTVNTGNKKWYTIGNIYWKATGNIMVCTGYNVKYRKELLVNTRKI